jgi:tetratricopeptide (TPR) repeat protein
MHDARQLCRKAIAAEDAGDIDAAIRHYSKAIQLDPDWSDVYVFRGAAFARRGDVDRAIADFSQAITLDPRDAGAYQRRASAFEQKGDPARAEADFAKSEELRSHRP